MDSSALLLAYAGAAIIGWLIFYYTIKAAVKWGTLDALQDHQASSRPTVNTVIEKPVNENQIKLQEKYNSGQITFEEYQNEWGHLG